MYMYSGTPRIGAGAYRGTPRIGAEVWVFTFFALKIIPRIGRHSLNGALHRGLFHLSNMLYTLSSLVFFVMAAKRHPLV